MSQEKPQVSIIVPVYNAEKYIGRCVESILGQEFRDFELILINDGSRDGSKEILDAFEARDKRVVVKHNPNQGVSATRNEGIAMARGEFIQFLDADDWLSPQATKLLVRTAADKNADLVIADFYRVVGDRIAPKGDIDTDEVMTVQEFGDYLMENPADFYYGVVWNKLYRTDIIRKYNLGMDPQVSFCEDFIFNLEYVTHCERIAALPVPVYYYVKTEGSLVTKSLNIKKITEAKKNVIRYYDDFFKKIHNEEDYKSRKADILMYLVEFARDDPASPLSMSTKKLGEESIPVYFLNGDDNVFAYNYYENKLLARLSHATAQKTGLKDIDVRMLLLLSVAKEGITIKEAVSYLECSGATALLTLQKLVRKQYAEAVKPARTDEKQADREEKPENREKKPEQPEETRYRLVDGAKAVTGDLKHVLSDFEDIRYDGFTEEEISLYRKFEERAVHNLKRILKDYSDI